MSIRSASVVAVLSLVATTTAAATLDDVLARHLAAQGGAQRLAALATLELAGRMTLSFGGDSTFELAWTRVHKRPLMVRSEASAQGLTAFSAFDGREGWQLQPFAGRREPERVSADDSKRLALDADLDGPLVGAREKGASIAYLGTEDVDGTLAHKLEVRRKGGDLCYVFVDPDSFLVIRVEAHTFVRGAENVDETDFGNYELVAGVWLPFAIESGPKGAPRQQRITVERAFANVPLDAALFRLPPAAPAPLTPPAADALPAGASLTVAGGSPATPVAASVTAARIDAGVLSGLGARNIGSATMSGRIAAVAAYNAGGKTVIFVGAASGGVWKSRDGGTTFKPVFDREPVQSIGAVALDPKNPQVVWVGTGEAWTRNSVSIGDGIYKSTDGGETWANMGLGATERITKIVVHPRDGKIVYACAPGKLWSDSEERGLYKTSDGGATWRLVLRRAGNLSTGCSGVSLDPRNPEVVFAALWDFRRQGWSFRSGGAGPEAPSGSGLFRSADGGATWTELAPKTNPGFPAKPYGRIEVVHAPSGAGVVYAFVEGVASALYRSADGGKTWDVRDKSQNMVWRPFYFARLVVDPHNADRLFKTNLGLIVSVDGGKSFSGTGGGAHGDWHDLWIDPDNTQHVIGGDDGGLWTSFDGGNRWWKSDNLPISQFYHVSVDERDPYLVYGGLQDNASFVAESAFPGGIDNSRWEYLYDGDGFWVFADPTDANAVYAEFQGGSIARVDRVTRAARDIQPKAGFKEKLRFNWNSPIHLSPHDKATLYLGGQFLFRTRDRGQSWERISPDLTTNDAEKQRQEESGGITVDNSSAEMHTTLYSISESPRRAGLIWVGTDDGNVQVTRDGGKSWTNVAGNVPDLPRASWVAWVEASRFAEGTAYAAFDRHTFGDMDPYVYRTTDFGKTWTRLAGPAQGLRGYVHVVKEDTQKAALLFVGTEFGLWVSLDSGASWAEFKGGGLPAVAVRDLAIQSRDNDLVLATHGRGLWIVDDITPLRALSDEVVADNAVFLAERPAQQRIGSIGAWVQGDAKFVGETAPGGAVVTYYQRTRHVFGPLKLEVIGPDGKVVDTLPATKRRGINRVSWSMRLPPPRVPRAAQLAFSATAGPRVLPGAYRVRLTKGKDVVEGPLAIGLDRRATYGLPERQAQLAALLRVQQLFGDMSDLVDRIEAVRQSALAKAKALGKGEALAARLVALADGLDTARKQIVATKEGGAITGEERLREHADQLWGALQSYEGRPGAYQLERIDVLVRELAAIDAQVTAVLAKDAPPLNDALEKAKLPPL